MPQLTAADSSAAQLEVNTLCALEDMAKNNLSLRKAAEKWGVGRERLRGRKNGVKAKQEQVPVNRKLSEDMEKALVHYCAHLDRIGVSARMQTVARSAQQILDASYTGPGQSPRLGKCWTSRFIKRHPQLFRIKQKSLDIKRCVTHDPSALFEYFRRLKSVISKYGIQPKDLWNFDEVGFRVGIGGPHWIITLEPDKNRFVASDTNRDSVTCCEAVSAAGDTIDPMVILPASNIYTAFIDNDLSSGTLLATSSEGYIDDLLALKWLKHFDQATKRRQLGEYRLLLLDGHGSHLTYDFISYAEVNKIIIFQLPPHSTHLLQPLDLLVFSPYKHWHREAVDAATRTGCTNFNKAEFLASLRSIRHNTFKVSTIQSAWRLAGIFPFNPHIVIDALRSEYGVPKDFDTEIQDKQQSTPAPSSPPRTPTTIRSFQRSADKLLAGNHQTPASPSLQRFIRGTLAQVRTLQCLESDLAQQTAEKQARLERQRNARRIIASGGVVYADTARQIEATRKATDRMNFEAARLKQDRLQHQHAAAATRLERERNLVNRADERNVQDLL